jgi:SAM-dependent MidA family methyltransferase
MLCETPDARAVANALRELPRPGPEAMAHSTRLIDYIRAEIDACGGRIGFDRFMELALYAPGLGYYSAGSHKLGEEGDFITAPELSPLFSRCVANQCSVILAQVGQGHILEFGAGSGVMAADILAELERLDALPERYQILEVSADLHQRQQQTLRQRVPQLVERVEWLTAMPEPGFHGVVLANELLDAMPVHRFRMVEGIAREIEVAWEDDRFVALADKPVGGALQEVVARIATDFSLVDGYESEVGLRAMEWIKGLGGFLAKGAAILIDYGFPRHEFYHPERSAGTLMCHYRHRSHSDPLILVGLQDITAHIDFTAVAERAVESGLHVAGFSNQANFLMANGLMEMVSGEGEPQRQLELAAQVKRLLLPGEMGELFKVMALVKGLEEGLGSFTVRDERVRL